MGPMVYKNGEETVYKMQTLFIIWLFSKTTEKLKKSQGNKPSVNMEDKDHGARIVADVRFVRTASKGHIAKIVVEVRFVSITR